MEGQNYSVKERLEQLEALMGKYTAGGKDLCVAFSGGVDSSLILKLASDLKGSSKGSYEGWQQGLCSYL